MILSQNKASTGSLSQVSFFTQSYAHFQFKGPSLTSRFDSSKSAGLQVNTSQNVN